MSWLPFVLGKLLCVRNKKGFSKRSASSLSPYFTGPAACAFRGFFSIPFRNRNDSKNQV